MGILETLALVAGAGVVMYYGYGVILSKLNEQQQVPPPIVLPAPAPSLPPTPPVASSQPPTNTIQEPTKTKEKEKSSSNNNKKKEEEPTPQTKSEPIVVPTTSEMTSPNVAGSSFTFNVVGDIDYCPATGQNLCGDNPTVTLIIGDFSYDCNSQKWWTGTMKACNGKKNLGSVGNHDCSGKGFIDLFPANGGKWEFIYKVGNIAFIAVNTGYCSAKCMNVSTSEPLFKQAQADPSVKFIVAHFHKPVFTSGTSPDAPMELHTMMMKYPKVKMAFAGHNHTYKRYVPQGGIQYITAGRGGHDAANCTGAIKKGPDSSSVGVVKCRVSQDGGISCQYVANSGEVLDSWGLTAQGKHTGTGGVPPKQGTASGESSYAQAFYTQFINNHLYDFDDKEDRDNAFISMMDRRNTILHPQRKFNNTIYHYNTNRYSR